MIAVVLFDLFIELGGVISRPREQLAYLMMLIRQAGRVLKFDKPAINKLTIGMTKAQGASAPKMRTKASEGAEVDRSAATHA